MSSVDNQGFTSAYVRLALIIAREADSFKVDWEKVASLYGYAKVTVCKAKWGQARNNARKNWEKGIVENEGFTANYAKLALMIVREANGYDVDWKTVASLYGYAKESVCRAKWSTAKSAARKAMGGSTSSDDETKQTRSQAQTEDEGETEAAKTDVDSAVEKTPRKRKATNALVDGTPRKVRKSPAKKFALTDDANLIDELATGGYQVTFKKEELDDNYV